MKKLISLALAAGALVALAAAPASASHSWGGYHWSRTANPFTVTLGSNLTGSWTVFLSPVSDDWSALPTVLDTNVVTGAGKKRCGAVGGRVEVCNDAYGYNGWLGIATVWTSGGHIVQGTVKMNDSYYAHPTYDTPEWRRSVLCQEIGHTFGLDHQSEDPNVNEDTCMDYYQVPNISPDAHDYEQLGLIYAHLDPPPTTTSGPGRGRKGTGGLRKLREALYVEDLGGGDKRFVFVTWTNPHVPHGAPAE
jgi:hypothetical protein